MVFTSSLRDASTDYRVNAFIRGIRDAFTRLTPVYSHNTGALQAGVFGSKSCSLTRSTYDAIKWKHRQLHEPLVRPSNFTGSGCLITVMLQLCVVRDGPALLVLKRERLSDFKALIF